MGGSGTWDLVTRCPELFAAAVPICGGADETVGWKIAQLPIWCFQGAKDEVVHPNLSRHMIAAIKRAGGAPRYTEFPEAGHNILPLVIAETELLTWLFAHHLSPASP